MDLKPTVHFRPESETEIAIWWDFDSELAEIIPANPEAIMEWIVNECGGEAARWPIPARSACSLNSCQGALCSMTS